MLYIASMFPSDFAQIIEEPNMMWRRIETSIESRPTWSCPLTFGSSKRKKPTQLITLPFEVEEIMEIQSRLKYEPRVLEQEGTRRAPARDTLESTVLDLQIPVPAQFRQNCQFCDRMPTLRCNCEVGTLLCAVWQASIEPRSQFPWERFRRLINERSAVTEHETAGGVSFVFGCIFD